MSAFDPTVKTPPTMTVTDVGVLRRQCRIADDVSDDDELLDLYVRAAQHVIEARYGVALTTQTLQASGPAFPCRLWLARSVPLQSVTFVKYYDAANVLQTLSASVYTVPAFVEPAYLTLAYGQTWPVTYARDDAVRVEYIVGASSLSLIPPPLVQAALLLVGHWYQNRELGAIGAIPVEIAKTFDDCCRPYERRVPDPVWEAA